MALAKWERPILARYGGGNFDKWARRNYGITGYGLLARLIKGESGGDQNAVSNANAKSITQFIPSTRRSFIDQFGIDAWKDKASAVRAAKIHLTHYGGLRGYNPGMESYPSYILNQNVGNVRRELRRTGHLTGRNEYTGKGQQSLRRSGGSYSGPRRPAHGDGKGGGHGGSSAGRPAVGTASSLRDLIGGGPTRTPVAGSAPQDPPFSARIALKFPETAGEIPGSETPGPRQSGVQLGALRQLLTSTPQTPPVPVSTAFGRATPPAGGFDVSPSRKGRPTPLNPARFQVGKSGRTALDKRHGNEVAMWRGNRWVYVRSGKPVRGLEWRPQGGSGARMGASVKGSDIRGTPYDRAGVPTSRAVRRFSERLSSVLDFPLSYGTGSHHKQFSDSGNQSDHWTGNAIDLPLAGRQLRVAGTKALRLVGKSRARARQMAFNGGIYNVNYKGRRYQIIMRTTDHYDHLHVGIR